MKFPLPVMATRSARILWLVALFLWVADWLAPVSSGRTRVLGLALFVVVWFGPVVLMWRWRGWRWAMLVITLMPGIILLLPIQRDNLTADSTMRDDYVTGLLRYEGVRYSWGGESPMGIDCSGLIRRGLIDSMFLRGFRTCDPKLVCQSIWLWWHDTTAKEIGQAHAGLTAHVLAARSINELDDAQLLPGDLAVTRDGVHVMAYTGGHTWIEADPGVGRVIRVKTPANDNGWFDVPVRIVRWGILKPAGGT